MGWKYLIIYPAPRAGFTYLVPMCQGKIWPPWKLKVLGWKTNFKQHICKRYFAIRKQFKTNIVTVWGSLKNLRTFWSFAPPPPHLPKTLMSLTLPLQSVEIRKPLQPINAYETLKSQKWDNILPYLQVWGRGYRDGFKSTLPMRKKSTINHHLQADSRGLSLK